MPRQAQPVACRARGYRAAVQVASLALLATTLTIVLGGSGLRWAWREGCESSATTAQALFDYASFYACAETLPRAPKMLLLAVWLALLISLLATTADGFFVPQLDRLSEDLRLPEDVAGVTLLALGNGMPDVMTATSAINKASDFPLMMGEFFGAANFILSFVLGCVLLCQPGPTKVERRALIRDGLSYAVVLVLMVTTTWDGEVTLLEALLFFAAYASYVAVVVVWGHCLPSRGRRRAPPVLATGHHAEQLMRGASSCESVLPEGAVGGGCALTSGVVANGNIAGGGCSEVSAGCNSCESRAGSTSDSTPTDAASKEDSLEGLDLASASSILTLVQLTMELPFSVARHLTVPAAVWNRKRRWLAALCPVLAPPVLILSFGGWAAMGRRWGPLLCWLWCALGGALLGAAMLAGSSADRRPSWHPLLLLFSIASVVAWFNLLANECVAVLETVGLNLGVSSSVLGITVLAWGNSVGDLVADTAVARQGRSRTAVAGCFGSPLLSDLLGLGISLASYTASHRALPVKLHRQNVVAAAFVAISIVTTVATFVLYGFRCPRRYALVLFAQYAAFLAASVLLEARRSG